MHRGGDRLFPRAAALVVLIVFICAALDLAAFSQPVSRWLRSLVDSEEAFARTAREKGVKEAFLAYLADDAIVFRPGPVPGRKVYEDMPVGSTFLLAWRPIFAEVSDGGDLGYTTGPYEARSSARVDEPAHYGHYVSVWERQPGGPWKVVFDAGICHPEPGQEKGPPVTRSDKIKLWRGARVDRILARKILLELERNFAEKASALGLIEAYIAFADRDIRLYRDQVLPFLGKEASLKHISGVDGIFRWEPIDGAVSSRGDLGYVFGSGEILRDEGEERTVEALSYLRIWRRTVDGQWRIVIDLCVPTPSGSKEEMSDLSSLPMVGVTRIRASRFQSRADIRAFF